MHILSFNQISNKIRFPRRIGKQRSALDRIRMEMMRLLSFPAGRIPAQPFRLTLTNLRICLPSQKRRCAPCRRFPLKVTYCMQNRMNNKKGRDAKVLAGVVFAAFAGAAGFVAVAQSAVLGPVDLIERGQRIRAAEDRYQRARESFFLAREKGEINEEQARTLTAEAAAVIRAYIQQAETMVEQESGSMGEGGGKDTVLERLRETRRRVEDIQDKIAVVPVSQTSRALRDMFPEIKAEIQWAHEWVLLWRTREHFSYAEQAYAAGNAELLSPLEEGNMALEEAEGVLGRALREDPPFPALQAVHASLRKALFSLKDAYSNKK